MLTIPKCIYFYVEKNFSTSRICILKYHQRIQPKFVPAKYLMFDSIHIVNKYYIPSRTLSPIQSIGTIQYTCQCISCINLGEINQKFNMFSTDVCKHGRNVQRVTKIPVSTVGWGNCDFCKEIIEIQGTRAEKQNRFIYYYQ